MATEDPRQPSVDTRRGIQNAQARFAEHERRRLTSERLYEKAATRDARDRNSDGGDEVPYEEMEREAYEANRTESQSRAQKVRKLLAVKNKLNVAKKGARAVAGASLIPSLIVLGFLSLLQFIFGIVTMIGFGLQGVFLYIRQETILGKIVGFFVDFQNYLPFEYVGYGFWALSILLSLCMFIGYWGLFMLRGVNPFRSAVSSVCTISCLALNLFPAINIFPWLSLWALYWILYGVVDTASSLFSSRS